MLRSMEAALNDQVKHEMASAYIYLSMAAYCENSNLPGMAHWLKLQAKEELAHALRFYEFIHDRGGKVMLQAIPQPRTDFASPVEVFVEVVKHEQAITGLIHSLYGQAVEEKDYASLPFLQSFITEQIEEEKVSAEILSMVKMAGGEPRSLFLLDRELGNRT